MDLVQNGMDKIWGMLGMSSEKNKIKADNKFVMITGCDTGLGNKLAKVLDEEGFNVIAACLFPEGEGAQKLVQETSSNLRIVGLDVTSDESCRAALQEVNDIIKNKSTGLHALINNAGMCVFGDFDWQLMKHVELVINVNLVGAMRVTKHFLPSITRKTGRIINVSSILSFNITFGLSVYGATKAGLSSFSDALRIELHNTGISVSTICPGLMTGATGLMQNSGKAIEEMWAQMSPTQKQQNEKKYQQMMKGSRKSQEASGSADHILQWTIDDIVECVTLLSPRSIYVPCTLNMRFMLFLVRSMPTGWANYFIDKMRSRT